MKRIELKYTLLLGALIMVVAFLNSCTQKELSPEEARTIAKEAYIYANPVVDSYRILYSYFVDSSSPDYKASWNEIKNIPRVYTHEDRAVQIPNSDTPYSWLALDLRTEPIVLTVPPIEKERYFSIQLIDLYTHNFAYIGSRTTGNDGGQFLITGPGWNGEVPDGITKAIPCETELMLAVYRTQLFSPEDLKNVIEIQDAYMALYAKQGVSGHNDPGAGSTLHLSGACLLFVSQWYLDRGFLAPESGWSGHRRRR